MWLTPALPPKGGRSDLGHHLYAMVTSFTTLDMPQAGPGRGRPRPAGLPEANGPRETASRCNATDQALPAAPNSS